jgi:hypothetical protein
MAHENEYSHPAVLIHGLTQHYKGKNNIQYITGNTNPVWAHGSVVVKALCYKPEGHRFETQ